MGNYPKNWKEIADRIKDKWDWKCERCGRRHNPETGYCLTVHHLDGDPGNCADWNLAALCQRCHLHVQNKLVLEQDIFSFYEISDWFKPHLEGYRNSLRGC